MPHRFRIYRTPEDAADGSDMIAVRESTWLETCPRCGETRESHGWETCRQCLWDLADPGWECPKCKTTNQSYRATCNNDGCRMPRQHGWLCGCGHRNPDRADECEACGPSQQE